MFFTSWPSKARFVGIVKRRDRHSESRKRSRHRPLVERLEDRTVPAVLTPPGGLISWWTGDGYASDIMGVNGGELVDGEFAPGQVADAFSFDGVDDFAQASTINLPVGFDDRTIELWVRFTELLPDPERFIAGYGNIETFSESYHLGMAENTLFFSQGGSTLLGPTLELDIWYHVAVKTAVLFSAVAEISTSPVVV